MQPFRCTVIQFRRCRWELDSLQRHRSPFGNGFPRTNIKIGLVRMTRKSRDSLKRNTKNTRHTSVIPAQHLVRLPFQKYVRKSRLDWETFKTPGWAKRLMKSSFFVDRKDMKKFFDALKTVYGPQSSGTTPLLSADGNTTWKEELNTLMMSLIGNHLSMMKLLTDYHRWNIIRCLMSS